MLSALALLCVSSFVLCVSSFVLCVSLFVPCATCGHHHHLSLSLPPCIHLPLQTPQDMLRSPTASHHGWALVATQHAGGTTWRFGDRELSNEGAPVLIIDCLVAAMTSTSDAPSTIVPPGPCCAKAPSVYGNYSQSWIGDVCGATYSLPCGGDSSGQLTRMCTANGVWAAEDPSACRHAALQDRARLVLAGDTGRMNDFFTFAETMGACLWFHWEKAAAG